MRKCLFVAIAFVMCMCVRTAPASADIAGISEGFKPVAPPMKTVYTGTFSYINGEVMLSGVCTAIDRNRIVDLTELVSLSLEELGMEYCFKARLHTDTKVNIESFAAAQNEQVVVFTTIMVGMENEDLVNYVDEIEVRVLPPPIPHTDNTYYGKSVLELDLAHREKSVTASAR